MDMGINPAGSHDLPFPGNHLGRCSDHEIGRDMVHDIGISRLPDPNDLAVLYPDICLNNFTPSQNNRGTDHKIEAGKTYRYAVTAVKKNGLESRQSEPVEAAAP